MCETKERLIRQTVAVSSSHPHPLSKVLPAVESVYFYGRQDPRSLVLSSLPMSPLLTNELLVALQSHALCPIPAGPITYMPLLKR